MNHLAESLPAVATVSSGHKVCLSIRDQTGKMRVV